MPTKNKFVIWTIEDLTQIALQRRKNEFDTIICFTGPRGNGKSCAGFKLCKSKDFKFNAKEDMIYDRNSLLHALQGHEKTIFPDEMINSAYKRDFHNVEQIDLIKYLTMYRDRRHLIVLCIPNFWDLDKPIRDLVKIRIDMISRKFGIVHRPLPMSYTNDPWDKANNEKVEKSWMKSGGNFKPRHHKLSTFVGFLKVPQLSITELQEYKFLKDEKRRIIAAEKGTALDESNMLMATRLEKRDIYDVWYNKLIDGKMSKQELIEESTKFKIRYKTALRTLNERLKVRNRPETVATFWKKKEELVVPNLQRKRVLDPLGFTKEGDSLN